MIQDIAPKQLHNEYVDQKPQDGDIVLLFEGSSVLGKRQGEEIVYPDYHTFVTAGMVQMEHLSEQNNETAQEQSESHAQADITKVYTFTYLLSVDEEKYFLAMKNDEVQKGTFEGEMSDAKVHTEYESVLEGYEFIGVDVFRRSKPKDRAFASITAYHLYGWYRDNRFCGRCGRPMVQDTKQRMLKCDCCHNMVFPKISPAVIVGITNGSRILFTKYTGRTYRNYALVAGFTEIGETLEDTVIREVKEEVGLDVTNVRYYKSQPWALSGSLLAGFFCDLVGDDTIQLEEDELALGEWVEAEDIDESDDGISLTKEMMLKFKADCMNQ